jgi:chromosome segregation ATPase
MKEVKKMEQTLHLILNKLDNLDQKVNSIMVTVAATNVKISETNQRIDILENKVDIIVDEVKEINNKMTTKSDLEYYDQKISEHSREIYKLKNN